MTHMYIRVAELVLKYHTGEISEEEKIELENIRQNSGLDPKMFEELLDVHSLAADLKQMKITDSKPVYSLTPKQTILQYAKVAAVVIPLLLVLHWLLLKNKKADDLSHFTNKVNVIKPAINTNKLSVKFKRRDLQHVLREWSGDQEVEVIYKDGIVPIEYTGDLLQSMSYVEFAQAFLEFKGYKSTFKGKKIIVQPNPDL